MIKIKTGVLAPKLKLVPDESYSGVLKSVINHAERRCLCSMFIVDLSPSHGKSLLVDTILLSLQASVWQGLDTRLLIGGSRTNFEIASLGLAAKMRADQLRIPCRLMESKKVRGSHVKMVIADDLILTGSHNWSIGSFTDQTQDSILVDSASLAARLVSIFEYQWERAGQGDDDGDV